jgi:transcriptional regulator with XRE-family HTH domain
MRDRNKKYLQKNESDCLHIGNLVAWFIQEKHLKKADIARKLNVIPTTLNQYFKQPSIQVGILWRLSLAMEYNLLADVAQRLPIAFETNVEEALKKTLSEKEAEIQHLKIELNLLKKIHKIE